MTTALTKFAIPIDTYLGGSLGVMTWAAGDTTGNTFAASGTEVVLAMNSDTGSSRTLTVTANADPLGRTTNFVATLGQAAGTSQSLANMAQLQMTPRLNSALYSSTGIGNGTITVTPSNAAVLLAVLTGV